MHLSNLPLTITEDEIKAEIESLFDIFLLNLIKIRHFGNVEDIKIIKKNSSG